MTDGPLRIRLTLDRGLAAWLRALVAGVGIHGDERATLLFLIREGIVSRADNETFGAMMLPHLPEDIRRAMARGPADPLIQPAPPATLSPTGRGLEEAAAAGGAGEEFDLGARSMQLLARANCGNLLESLQEGLMTDSGLTEDDRKLMRAQIDALEEALKDISQETPERALHYGSYMLPEGDQQRLKALAAAAAAEAAQGAGRVALVAHLKKEVLRQRNAREIVVAWLQAAHDRAARFEAALVGITAMFRACSGANSEVVALAGEHRASDVYEAADLALAKAPAAGDGWLPMATAPRDGSRIDLLYPYPRGRTIDCFWGECLGEPRWIWRTPAWGEEGELLPEDEWRVNCYPNAEPLAWRHPPALPTEPQPLPAAPPDAAGMLALIVRLHREEVLSEGQVAQATGLDRIEIRRLADEQEETARV